MLGLRRSFASSVSRCGFPPVRLSCVRSTDYSTQEYIKNVQFPTIPHPQSFLAATCVVYLDPYVDTWVDFDGLVHSNPGGGLDSHCPFLEYARSNWGRHARLSQDGGEEDRSAIPWALSRHFSYPVVLFPNWYIMFPSLSAAAWYGLVNVIESRCLDFPTPELRRVGRAWDVDVSTPFHSAAGNHQFDAFVALLSAYWDEAQGLTLWTCSGANGMQTVLHVAVKRPILLGDQRQHVHTFLKRLLAIANSPPTKAMQLMFSDFDINVQDYSGVTPLMVACQWTGLHVIRLLVDNGGDPTMADSKGYTAFLYAVDRHDRTIEICQWLLTISPSLINHRDRKGKTALMLTVSRVGDPAVTQLLLSQSQSCLPDPKSSVNARDLDGRTALMHAFQLQYEYGGDSRFPAETINILLADPSLDVRLTDRWGRSIPEVMCSAEGLITLDKNPVHDPFFPLLYTLLDIEGGWDVRSMRKAVIAGVRHLSPKAVFRLLLEDWVKCSFIWSTDHPDTVTLLVQAFSRIEDCRGPVSIVLYHLGLLEPSLHPGDVQTLNMEALTEAFCGREGCRCSPHCGPHWSVCGSDHQW